MEYCANFPFFQKLYFYHIRNQHKLLIESIIRLFFFSYHLIWFSSHFMLNTSPLNSLPSLKYLYKITLIPYIFIPPTIKPTINIRLLLYRYYIPIRLIHKILIKLPILPTHIKQVNYVYNFLQAGLCPLKP